MRYHHKAEICCLCLQWDLIYFEAAEDLLWWFRTGRARRREKEWQKNRESKKLPGKKHPCLLFESSLTMFVITRQRNWRLITLIARCRHFFDDVFFLLFDKISFFCFIVCLRWVLYIYQVGKYGIRVCHKSKFDIWDTGRVELVPFRLRYLVRSRAKWWFRVIGRLVLVLMLAQQNFVCRHEYVLFDNFRV